MDDSWDDRPSTTSGESDFIAQVTQQELRDYQLKDSDIRPVLSWLEEILYYLWNTATQTILLVVPRELKTSVLEQVHDTITAGHLGHDKTLQKLGL